MQAWEECSLKLIQTKELDPVYNLVVYARDTLGLDWAERFCMAHLMFYNVETSITLADVKSEHFWHRVLQGYPDWKRGQERRHYRGASGLQSIDSLRIARPEGTFRTAWSPDKPLTYKMISKFINMQYKGFGSYFTLKWADFVDVLYKGCVDYSVLLNPAYLFEGSVKGLLSIWPDRPLHESLLEIRDFISKHYEPFQGYRLCGLSEAETVACAYRTYYVKNTYKFGWDINNLRTTLTNHPSYNARALLAGVPKPVEA